MSMRLRNLGDFLALGSAPTITLPMGALSILGSITPQRSELIAKRQTRSKTFWGADYPGDTTGGAE